MRGRASVTAALVIAVACASTAPAQAVFFGADLRRPANAAFDCTVIPSLTFPLPSGAPTCTWFASGTARSLRESFTVPAGRGRIVRALVRTGPVTGPMRVVVLRSVRDPRSRAPAACCRERLRSRVFVPRRNAITVVRVRFAVRNDRVPNPESGLVSFDTIALSVLAPGVPVPAHVTGELDPLSAPIASTFYPAIRAGGERADVTGTIGFQPLLRGEWLPTGR